jgi:pimeloyl-ACP methyl ester carboxylesterase
LFVYGQHTSLEQWLGLLKYLNRYGTVTAPDLPGFGGMDSFFTIGKLPTIDAYADYLAAFIKLRFRRKQVHVVAVGFGFIAVTRMLQRYPHLARHVQDVTSLDGYARYDDLALRRRHYRLQRLLYAAGSWRLTALALRGLYLNRYMLPRLVASRYSSLTSGVADDDAALLAREAQLWRQNDLRTHMFTTTELLTFDNCSKRVNVSLWHVRVTECADHQAAEQRLRVVFDNASFMAAPLKLAAIGAIDAVMARKLIPEKLRQQLAQ